jgi:hypothetical protein
LLPLTPASGNFLLSFSVDPAQYNAIFNAIQQETGLSAGSQNLIIRATVRLTAQTGVGRVEKTFTHEISTDLRGGILDWTGVLKKAEPGVITTDRVVMQPGKLWGMPVMLARVIFGVGAGLMLVLLLIGLMGSPLLGGSYAQTERQAREMLSKYKDIIIEARDMPEIKADEKVLSVNSLEDLIKTSQGLLKPILHKAEYGQHVYCVFDDSTRYQYVIISTRNKNRS